MDLLEAKTYILGSEHTAKLREMEKIFEEAARASSDGELRLENYFFLLMAAMQRTQLLTQRLISDVDDFHQMLQKELINHSQSGKKDKIAIIARSSFIGLWSHRLNLLERIANERDFSDLATDFRVAKMELHRLKHFYEKRYFSAAGYSVMNVISGYGTSFNRLALTTVMSTILFAAVFQAIDAANIPELRFLGAGDWVFSDYFHFSLGTISNLGASGDPHTLLQKVIMDTETIYGVFLIGTLINVISKRI